MSNIKNIKNIGDLPRWDLTDLYPSPESEILSKDIEDLRVNIKNFSNEYKGNITDKLSIDELGLVLYGAICQYEKISEKMGQIGSYATLYHVTDTSSSERSKFYGDTISRLTDLSNDLIFFDLELNQLDDDILLKALDNIKLSKYRPWIENVRKYKKHQLSDQLERLLQEKSVTGSHAWNRLFDQTMAGFQFTIDDKPYSLEPTLSFLLSPDETIRKKAADALSSKFAENISLFTLITNTLAKDKSISDNIRKYEEPSDSRHLANNIEPEVVQALVKSVSESYPKLSHRYYALKAKWLGKEKLNYWDRNAPLSLNDNEIISWDEAKNIVIESYSSFSEEIGDIANQFFSNNWIDAPSLEGKVSGAFAHPTTPNKHPYILLNYQGRARDVMTLAHELGHGIHQTLSSRHGPLMANAPLTVSETASVFGEMLTYQKLLSKADSKESKRMLIASKVEDMLNTVVRQISFYQFEESIHKERKNGELTTEDINSIWMKIQKDSLGPAVNIDDNYKYYWCYIPHFIHSPFYVYAYAFGDCLVNSLYAIYRDSSTNFVEKYIDLLKAGATKHHTELLSPFNLDALNPEFWKAGLSLIENMIDELEVIEKD
ncbi:M3 family oligoendopeptidase [Hyphomicrobiales bacterium]|jgi:oligoendopeptidase F|nr:M3 family oligoendopeptidase [Rhodobiaceae bacterium]MBT6222501.1 M3 family oligoendopeptidase [Rhodobiaceae bacterium]MDB4128187.1 M3 family oligoendopeptidase [Hyphomicrobiales bacterium]